MNDDEPHIPQTITVWPWLAGYWEAFGWINCGEVLVEGQYEMVELRRPDDKDIE